MKMASERRSIDFQQNTLLVRFERTPNAFEARRNDWTEIAENNETERYLWRSDGTNDGRFAREN